MRLIDGEMSRPPEEVERGSGRVEIVEGERERERGQRCSFLGFMPIKSAVTDRPIFNI